MDLIKSVGKRGVVAVVFRNLFDVIFVVFIFGSLQWFEQPWVALGLVILSKWRMFAVRPRYWVTNVLSNLTDLILGLAIVVLMWECGGSMALQIVLAVLYLAWLIIIKPRSKYIWILIQAGVSQFVGLWALFSVADRIGAAFTVALAFVIGFSAARHVLVAHREDSRTLLAMAWGIIVAELGFVGFHWTIAYTLIAPLAIPQIAIIVAAIAFATERCYDSYRRSAERIEDRAKKGQGAASKKDAVPSVVWREVRVPVIFSAVLVLFLLFLRTV